jgi:hypothetical protein
MPEQRARILGRFSLVDLLVFAVIAGIVAVAVVKLGPGRASATQFRRVSVTAVASGIRNDAARNLFSVGDEVHSMSDQLLGRVTKVVVEPATIILTGSGGDSFIQAKSADRSDVLVTFVGRAEKKGYFFKIRDVDLKVWNLVELHANHAEVSCRIVNVEIG